MTTEALFFICHAAEAAAGSQCLSVRGLKKKQSEEAAQFSADSQLTGRKEQLYAAAT